VINNVGEKIRQLRLLAGLSQENIAEEIGMSHGNFGKIERGEIDINTQHLFAVAKALKVDVTDLFDFNNTNATKEIKNKFGFATKADIEKLTDSLNALSKAIENIQLQIHSSSKTAVSSKSKSKKR
jgi:transcriptional regulator with XRE-family HTH domain